MNGWHYTPLSPSDETRLGKQLTRWLTLWDWMVAPEFEGLDLIPQQGPVLLVGNHSLMAFADASLMMRAIWQERGILCRSLALHGHFKLPVWGRMLAASGAVDGTRENCTAMMQAGEHIIVYPGGGGEVMKRKGEQHTLRWKNRTGFARMAIQNGCTVVPFSTVGADDCYDILWDNRDMQSSRIGQKLVQLSGLKPEEFPPLLKGWGPTLIPKPQKMYFRFHEPIDASAFQGMDPDDGAWALRQQVEHTVNEGLSDLLARRQAHGQDSLTRRLARRLVKTLQG